MKRTLTVVIITVMILSFFFLSDRKFFCDDTGNTNNTNSKNPQTAVVLNVQYQHFTFANYELNLPAIAKQA